MVNKKMQKNQIKESKRQTENMQKPAQLFLGITSDCNLDCEFCCQTKKGTLQPKTIEQLLDTYDPEIVVLTGGEPLLHVNIIEIIRMVLSKGKQLDILSNGTVYSSELDNIDPHSKKQIQLHISLHSANASNYQGITGRNRFNDVLKNIARYSESFKLSLATAVYQKNFQEAPSILDLAIWLELPVYFNLVYPINPARKVDLISNEQLDKLQQMICSSRLLSRSVNSSFIYLPANYCKLLQEFYNIPKTRQCDAELKQKLYIAPDKSRHSCDFIVNTT